VDIEEHLALHEDVIDGLVRRHVDKYRNPDDYDELWPVIRVDLWKRHENGYDHNGGASLLTYAWPYLTPLIHETLSQYRHYGKWSDIVVVPTAGGDNEEGVLYLDDLQEMAEEQGRNRLYLEPLYDEPMPGIGAQPEGTLTPEDQGLYEKLMANLTPEELAILEVSDRSCENAAQFLTEVKGMKMSDTTYWRNLRVVRAKVKDLAQGFSIVEDS
jgi:hypothetical protein